MKSLIVILMTLMPALVWAAEEGGEFSAKLFTYQCINVGAMVIGLVYFLRVGVKQFFKDKRKAYLAAAEKSQQAKKEAELERSNVQARLNKLENSADESIARAKAEAADLRRALLAEAQSLSHRIQDDAAKSASMEADRAQRQLREQVIKESVAAARGQLSAKVSPEEHQRLQGEFINHMQGMQK